MALQIASARKFEAGGTVNQTDIATWVSKTLS